jgi:leucyl aminopeptidase
MTSTETTTTAYVPSDVLLAADSPGDAVPVRLVGEKAGTEIGGISAAQSAWLAALRFKPAAKRLVLLPGADGSIDGAVLGTGAENSGEPAGPSQLLAGLLPTQLPPGIYGYAGEAAADPLAAIAWGLGAYKFRRYKTGAIANDELVRLKVGSGIDRARVLAIVEAVWLARDLINTPASDMGPAELEAAARALGERHGAKVTSTVGDDLLAANLRLIHAVGRASVKPPRLIDLNWRRPGARDDAPKVTLVGKGICFDTGGLDIKPASGMLLMKKDMGGAATVLALGAMIMALGLDVKLRVLIPAAENAISGDAFRPQDVIRARDGRTVEIGNTDAEGRLVLSDALSLADEEAPDTLLTFSTLTGAARVALGPELMPVYTDDDVFAAQIAAAGMKVGDPTWRMPFWPGYERNLDSEVADMGNVGDGPFAGSIVAALFLRRFVKRARRFAHFDIYGWSPAAKPLGPKGGEPHAARAMLEVIEGLYRPA